MAICHIEFWLVTLVRICRQVTNKLVAVTAEDETFPKWDAPEFRTFFGVDIESVLTPTRSGFTTGAPMWDAMNTSTNCCGVTRKRR
jgi:hypothetical protein